ncbi:MAG: hypothetical protein AAF989_00505, partial [Planctomycetota bacterium]
RWQADAFNAPFEFEFSKIKRIDFDRAQTGHSRSEPNAFQLRGGDLLTGRMLGADGNTLTIHSETHGQINLTASNIQRLYRVVDNPTLVFPHLSGLADWQFEVKDSEFWQEDGADIWSDHPDASATASLGIPAQSIIEFELAWKGSPNFHLALGCDAGRHPDESSGWAITCIGKTLAVFREREQTADLDILSMLQDDSSIRLTAYLDQASDQIFVYTPDGTMAGSLDAQSTSGVAEPSPSEVGEAIRLTNREGNVRLSYLRVSKWIGKEIDSPTDENAAVTVTTTESEVVRGTGFRFSEDAKTLIVDNGEGSTTIAIADLAGLDMRDSSPDLTDAANDEERRPKESRDSSERETNEILIENGDSGEPNSEPVPHSSEQVAVPPPMDQRATLQLVDGSRLTGKILSFSHSRVEFHHLPTNQPITLRTDAIRALSFRDADWVNPEFNKPMLRWKKSIIRGDLSAAQQNQDTGLSVLAFRPVGSSAAAPFRSGVSATITQVSPAPKKTGKRNPPRAGPSKAELQQIRKEIAQFRAGKRGLATPEVPPPVQREDPSVASADAEVETYEHEVQLTSGDRFACRILGSGEQGLMVDSREGGKKLVPHTQVKAAKLVRNATTPNIVDAKKRRLLTVPRLQKDSPPTHLLVAKTGDMLRCRLLKITPKFLHAEVRLSEVRFPLERVTQIIWLHPEVTLKSNRDSDSEVASSEPGGAPVETEDDGQGIAKSNGPKTIESDPTPAAKTTDLADRDRAGLVASPSQPFADFVQAVVRPDRNRLTITPVSLTDGTLLGEHAVFGKCQIELNQV